MVAKKTKNTLCVRKKVAIVMKEYAKRKLKSHGHVVTDKDQAVAIAYSEARKKCGV